MGQGSHTYTLEFYADENGHEPVRAFMKSLSPVKRRAIGVALQEVLQHLGPAVVQTDYGKALGDGLYEFRLDQDAEQILRKKGKNAKPEPEEAKILLRVFFHTHGSKVILLLSGYDKAERTSKQHQNSEIESARKLLKRWKMSQKMKLRGERIGSLTHGVYPIRTVYTEHGNQVR